MGNAAAHLTRADDANRFNLASHADPQIRYKRSISQAQQKGKPVKRRMMRLKVHKMPHAIAALQTPFRVPGQKR
jgi:hypothetical protein